MPIYHQAANGKQYIKFVNPLLNQGWSLCDLRLDLLKKKLDPIQNSNRIRKLENPNNRLMAQYKDLRIAHKYTDMRKKIAHHNGSKLEPISVISVTI